MEMTKGGILDAKVKQLRAEGQHPKACVTPGCGKPRATPTGKLCAECLDKARVARATKAAKARHAAPKTAKKPEPVSKNICPQCQNDPARRVDVPLATAVEFVQCLEHKLAEAAMSEYQDVNAAQELPIEKQPLVTNIGDGLIEVRAGVIDVYYLQKIFRRLPAGATRAVLTAALYGYFVGKGMAA